MKVPTGLLLLGITVSAGAQDAPPTPIRDEVSCPACTITVRPLVTLGDDDGPGAFNGRPMSVNADARGRYWVFTELEPPSVFSPSGKFVQTVGRKGSGPGEFRGPNFGAVVGDSMVVFDWVESRATVVGPDLRAARTLRLQGRVQQVLVHKWPGDLTISGSASREPGGPVLHRATFADSMLRVVSSFGPAEDREFRVRPDIPPVVGPHPGSRFLTADWGRYRVTLWTATGSRVTQVERKPSWFAGEGSRGIGGPTRPPEPVISAVTSDSTGLVWVFVSVPAPTWRDGWPTQSGRGEFAVRNIDFSKIYRTTVEVIDLTRGRVVARKELDAYVLGALPGLRAATYTVDAAGIPRVGVVQLELRGMGGR